ncbi:MAG TPA: hypothetical protein VHU86_09595 [Solirubrobacterales bacterium]|jgi:hypothetical protein|nr:hypothetical protein [Solirubrobacterales bacterium]
MALAENIQRARWGLELARLEETEQITSAVQESQIVGLLGEGEVGKTETIRQALGRSTPEMPILEVDLDGAASDAHVAFLIARQIASALLGEAEFSVLKVGVLVPASIESRRAELAQLLNLDGLDEALRDWPSGNYGLPSALAALERLAYERDTILWVDHIEAPDLTPRHPLDLGGLFWGLRAIAQRIGTFSLVLSGRIGGEAKALGHAAAFHQQGRWLTLDNPPPEVWRQVARGLKIRAEVATELSELISGHPETMLLALLEMTPDKPKQSPEAVVRQLASAAGALSARAMQHARTLHRLGGQVLVQVAFGAQVYGAPQRGSSPQQEITKVLGRLRQAGLVRRDDGGWSPVNPLIGMALRGELRGAPAPDRESAESTP